MLRTISQALEVSYFRLVKLKNIITKAFSEDSVKPLQQQSLHGCIMISAPKHCQLQYMYDKVTTGSYFQEMGFRNTTLGIIWPS